MSGLGEIEYQIQYVDPPWKYNETGEGCAIKSIDKHYNVASISTMRSWAKQFEAMRPSDKSISSAIFMWTTKTYIKQAIPLMEFWGFSFTCIWLTWTKTYPNQPEKVVHGPGNHLASCVEYLLMGQGRGQSHALRPMKGSKLKYKDWIQLPREEHSKKPDKIREMITDVYGNLKAVEVFARQHASGWDAIGDQLPNPVIIRPGEIVKPARSIIVPGQVRQDLDTPLFPEFVEQG